MDNTVVSFIDNPESEVSEIVSGVELLLKAGADVNARDNYGKTALDYAREQKRAYDRVVELLEAAQKASLLKATS